MIAHHTGAHDAYLDGERVDRWDRASVTSGWIESTEGGGPPAMQQTTRRHGRVELVDRVTGRVVRPEE